MGEQKVIHHDTQHCNAMAVETLTIFEENLHRLPQEARVVSTASSCYVAL